MKFIASGLLALGLIAIQVTEANAVVCAGAPITPAAPGPRGAVTTHRGYGYGGARSCGPACAATSTATAAASAPDAPRTIARRNAGDGAFSRRRCCLEHEDCAAPVRSCT